MKTKIFTIASVIILIILIATFSGIDSNEEQEIGDYISITTSYMTTYNKSNDYAEYGTTIYEYNLESKEITEIFSFPHNTFYPLGVYDKKTNSVYYTKERDNESYEREGTGDQIYVYNLETGSDKMLTEDLFAVNYIIPVDGAIFFLAARLDDDSGLSLGKIDLSDGSVKYWNEPSSISTRSLAVDKSQKRIYVAIYDDAEEDTLLLRDVEEHATPEYTIYSFDYNLDDKQEILQRNGMAVKALYVMDNTLLYRMDDTISPLPDTKTISEVVDLSNMKVLFQTEEQFPDRGSFTRDKKGAYILKSIGEDQGIYYYDFETQEYSPILKSDFGSIANFQLIYQD